MTNHTPIRLHRAAFVGSFSVSLILSLLLAVNSVAHGIVALIFGASLLAVSRLMGALVERGRGIDWLLGVAALNLFVVVPELGLELAGFSYESGIQFGYPRPSRMIAFEPDAKLFWRLPPSDPDVNSLGFLGDEVAVPKPTGTFRMLFLGDSCTYQRYPLMVGSLLSQRPEPRLAVETVNLGVPGYTSHQGRLLAEMYAERFAPDLVFVHYGWNDHWLAYGETDANKVVEPPTGLLALRPVRALMRLRVLQLGRKVWRAVRPGEGDAPLDRVRVPPDEYRENLREIRRIFGERGVPVVFVTAPTAHSEQGVPDYLVEQRFAKNGESVERLHREYIEMTREVGREGSRSSVIDLAAAFDRVGRPGLHFMADGIHFQYEGLALIAERVARVARPLLAGAESELGGGADGLRGGGG